MSPIGPTNFGIVPRTNIFAGSIRGNPDSDDARVTAAYRSLESDHERFTDKFMEADHSEKSGDRDAEGSYIPLHRRTGSNREEPEADVVHSRRSPSSLDENVGRLIDVEA